MRRIVAGTLVLLIAASIAMAQDDRQAKPATPAEQYQALLKENKASGGVCLGWFTLANRALAARKKEEAREFAICRSDHRAR